jgi:hypothetical protein
VTIQVFISYARDDDSVPPGRGEAKGFVTFLDEQLRSELIRLGTPRPTLWRDKRRIDAAGQFDPLITAAINESALLMVVLSRNWIDRPWCLRELELFRARWPTDEAARQHIVVVAMNQVRDDLVPELLRGQTGFRFYDLDRENEAGQEDDFFARGRILDPRYESCVDAVARYVWRTAARLETPDAEPKILDDVRLPVVRGAAKGRTIFLAKPAADLGLAYDRLVQDLVGAGYSIVPAPTDEIPKDSSATDFINTALSEAELSVHLIGDKLGYAPEEVAPIVPLQLACARQRPVPPGSKFRRILWAPRFVAEGKADAVERDPQAVAAERDRPVDSDTVVGDNLSAFAEFLLQHLASTAPAAEVAEPPGDGANVYVYHRPEDEAYAVDLAVALRKRKMRAVLPAFEGNAAELDAFHRESLRDCAAVVLCWANASEVWARATCRELRSWEKLGRTVKFTVRGLVAGPPPSGRKSVLVKLPPDDEIDVVLDLTTLDRLSPEALDPLLRAAAPGSD